MPDIVKVVPNKVFATIKHLFNISLQQEVFQTNSRLLVSLVFSKMVINLESQTMGLFQCCHAFQNYENLLCTIDYMNL